MTAWGGRLLLHYKSQVDLFQGLRLMLENAPASAGGRRDDDAPPDVTVTIGGGQHANGDLLPADPW
ncbi:MAG: hypothetical protein DRG59_13465 [Deltaproteobacteria bacterium]|nr:MAG: hypothetical protein DRG59_13465 [Deltaproteobacteria bacterium]